MFFVCACSAVRMYNLCCIHYVHITQQTVCFCSYNASLCRLPQQSSKGDNRRHAGTVEEEEGGHALQAHAVFEVTQIVGSFPFDVQY